MKPQPLAGAAHVPATQILNGTAVRGEWADPEDRNTRSAKPRNVIGVRRADPLLPLHKSGTLTDAQLRCCERYRDDWEISQGAKPGYERPEIASSSNYSPAVAQLDALKRFREATQAVGPTLSRIVVSVVLAGEAPTAYATGNGVGRHNVMGYLMAALDRLVDFYEPTIKALDRTPRDMKEKNHTPKSVI